MSMSFMQGSRKKNLLNLNFDGENGSTNFVDLTGRTITSSGNVSISTVQSVNGGSSGFFSGGFLETTNTSDINFSSSNNFTIETWIYKTATNSVQAICSNITGNANRGYSLLIHSNECLRFQSDGANPDIISNLTVPTNQWSKISLIKSGTNYLFTVDSNTQNITNLTGWQSSTSTTFRIGRTPRNDFPYPFTGYLDDLKIE